MNRELDVQQPDDLQRQRDSRRLGADLIEHLLADGMGRQHTGGVPGVDPSLLDVLHDPRDPDLVPVT